MNPETLRVKDPDVPGGILINEADFDPAKHQLYEAPGAGEKTPEELKAEATAALKADLEGMSYQDLQQLATERGIKAGGRKKEDLVAELLATPAAAE